VEKRKAIVMSVAMLAVGQRKLKPQAKKKQMANDGSNHKHWSVRYS
jgi:hypothetical protein